MSQASGDRLTTPFSFSTGAALLGWPRAIVIASALQPKNSLSPAPIEAPPRACQWGHST